MLTNAATVLHCYSRGDCNWSSRWHLQRAIRPVRIACEHPYCVPLSRQLIAQSEHRLDGAAIGCRWIEPRNDMKDLHFDTTRRSLGGCSSIVGVSREPPSKT